MKVGDHVIVSSDAPFKFLDGIKTGVVTGVSLKKSDTVWIKRDGLNRRGNERNPQSYSLSFWEVIP